MRPPVLELAAIIVVAFMFYIAYLYLTFSSGSYMDDLSFDPAAPSSVVHAEKFASAVPGFELLSELLTFESDSGYQSLSALVDDDAVYAKGYYSINGSHWWPFNLTGQLQYGNWINGSADIRIDIPGSLLQLKPGMDSYSEGHIAFFSCTETVMGWDCRQGKWQLVRFQIRINVSQYAVIAKTCEDCSSRPGYECIEGECVPVTKDTVKIIAGESLAIKIGGEKYLIRVTAIDGSGESAKLYINGDTIGVDKGAKSTVSISALRFTVVEIKPFSATEDGYVEIRIEGEYEVLESCPECIPYTGSSSSRGGSSVGGGGCTPDCSCQSGTCVGQSCDNGCGGTCPGTLEPDCGDWVCGVSPNGCGICGTCNVSAGEYCSNGTCVTGNCTSNCTCAEYTCVGQICDDGCGNPCNGTLEPDCGERVCGPAPNGCGSCGTCPPVGYTCMEGICLPVLPDPPDV
jgi:hypothetical protein